MRGPEPPRATSRTTASRTVRSPLRGLVAEPLPLRARREPALDPFLRRLFLAVPLRVLWLVAIQLLSYSNFTASDRSPLRPLTVPWEHRV